MDLKSTHSSPVLADSASMSNSRLGLRSALFPYTSNSSSFSSSLILNVPRKRSATLEDVRATLFDTMISSSPTHNILSRELSSDSMIADVDVAYLNWMLNYPSALASFEQLENAANGKRIALFLDYDGTLSPIVDDPDRAFMSNAMRATVQNVARQFPTAIISGRRRDQVYEFVGLTELYYAGSHGMDIMFPVQADRNSNKDCIKSTDKQGKEVNIFQPAGEFLPLIEEVFKSLVEITKDVAGAIVENNKFCVSVHYRNVDQGKWDALGQCVLDILKEYPRLRLTHGRKVLEVRPVLNWDKGKAVEFLLESLGLTNCDDVLPIYIGDDRTDEDAFKVLKEGEKGFGILVSSIPKESDALYSLRDPSEVMEFLKKLVMWKEKSGSIP